MPIKLSVERQTNVGRLCKITEWGTFPDAIDIQTPAYLTYTRFGHIPHITWDVAENELSLKQKQIYQLTLASLQTNVGRLCKITEWGTFPDAIDIQTPAYLTYTRFGHIPHITWDVAENELLLKQKQIYQLTLASFFEALETIEKESKNEGVASFCCMPLNSIRHLSLHDPLAKIPEGFNNNKSMAIWSGKAGRRSIEPENFIKILKTCKPHSFTALWDYDTPFNVQKKRHGKSLFRSSEWNIALFEKNHTVFEEPGFLPLAGGISKESRLAFAKYFGPKPYANGFLIDLYHFSHGENIQNKSEFEVDVVADLISDVTLLIQQDVPRLVEGAFDPYQIYCLVKNGCD
uniref:tRNA-guanine(15) transglycosylase-like domain-containing protein n=1 Tax=Panagrolaimus sp. ES5 TaxID=591445 RepID=A0AC34FYU4_9BILA